jgi:hypothetical protein
VLAYHSATGEVSVLLLHADGSRTWQSIGSPSDDGMRPVGYADVDGDEQADLFWRDAMSGANEIWLMNGTSYSVLALPDKPASNRLVALRDFTGDGLADALFADPAAGTGEFWELDGDGRGAVIALDAAPAGMALAGAADVDGDDSPDLIWHDTASDAVEGWRMNGTDAVAVFSLPSAPSNGTLTGSGDFDGDGMEDLAWYNRQNGSRYVRVWFMNGMNNPSMGIARRFGKKLTVRGVVDADSDGRADLVLRRKAGVTAYTVDDAGTMNDDGEMEWTTQAISLDEMPTSKRWYFLVLE